MLVNQRTAVKSVIFNLNQIAPVELSPKIILIRYIFEKVVLLLGVKKHFNFLVENYQ